MARAFAVWLTGLPASGKSTIARALERELAAHGIDAAVLESDVLRAVLTPHATYSDDDRRDFYRAFSYIGTLLTRHGVPVIFDATANRRAYRRYARAAIADFIEVYVACPLDLCRARDPKGLYRRAAAGEIATIPGAQIEYEPPLDPDLIVSGDDESPEHAAQRIVAWLDVCGYVCASSGREAVCH
jgi:adenylylsulfate kinase